MIVIQHLFEQLITGQSLSHEQMQRVIAACMQGELSDAQIATFLALMRMKGETVAELTAAAQMMQQYTRHIALGDNLIDLVGTGGDGKNTFNISTVSSFVVAAAGVAVAKHGNYSVSSRSGSADFLLRAGFELNLTDDVLQHAMQHCGIAFLFAPHFHQTMQHVRNARKELGIRTLFNLLGPLLNPAQVRKQVVGVFSSEWLHPIAQVLANLGSQHALVVHSQDGLDEISVSASTDVVEYHQGQFKTWTINPKDYDCFHEHLDAAIIDTPEQSLAIAEAVLSGQPGTARDLVILNSAAALYCAEHSDCFASAVERATHLLDSGEPAQRFAMLRKYTQQDKRSADKKR